MCSSDLWREQTLVSDARITDKRRSAAAPPNQRERAAWRQSLHIQAVTRRTDEKVRPTVAARHRRALLSRSCSAQVKPELPCAPRAAGQDAGASQGASYDREGPRWCASVLGSHGRVTWRAACSAPLLLPCARARTVALVAAARVHAADGGFSAHHGRCCVHRCRAWRWRRVRRHVAAAAARGGCQHACISALSSGAPQRPR